MINQWMKWSSLFSNPYHPISISCPRVWQPRCKMSLKIRLAPTTCGRSWPFTTVARASIQGIWSLKNCTWEEKGDGGAEIYITGLPKYQKNQKERNVVNLHVTYIQTTHVYACTFLCVYVYIACFRVKSNKSSPKWNFSQHQNIWFLRGPQILTHNNCADYKFLQHHLVP